VIFLFTSLRTGSFDYYYKESMDPWTSAFFYMGILVKLFFGLISLVVSIFFYIKTQKRTRIFFILTISVIYIVSIVYPFTLFNSANKKVSAEFESAMENANEVIECIEDYYDSYGNLPNDLEESSCESQKIFVKGDRIDVRYSIQDNGETYTLSFSTGWYYHKYYSDNEEWSLFQD
jgi:glucan phosphoethanolaminetransferase (alkaline phosphatase superfamily)